MNIEDDRPVPIRNAPDILKAEWGITRHPKTLANQAALGLLDCFWIGRDRCTTRRKLRAYVEKITSDESPRMRGRRPVPAEQQPVT